VKSPVTISVFLVLLSLCAFDLHSAAASGRSVSPSGQFIIYGGDAAGRGAISMLAEQLRANLLAILQRRDQWATAAVINLQPRAANLPEIPNAALRFSQTGSGLKLQLDLAVSEEMSFSIVEREILRLILLEMIYRNQPGIRSGDEYVEPPNWLVEGLLALMLNRDRTVMLSALAAVKELKPPDEFLGERGELLDPVGRSLYRAYSLALVQILMQIPHSSVVTSIHSLLLRTTQSPIWKKVFPNSPEIIVGRSGNQKSRT